MAGETRFDRSFVESWIRDDPNREDAQELQDLLRLADGGDQGAAADLANRFSGTLTFGTAGLRGRVGAGPNRMNEAVVVRAAGGLVNFLRDRLPDGFTVVVGYDARHRSKEFAQATAEVVVAAGGHALLFDRAVPTPLTAFTLLDRDADAAVMVTASHNPKEDNGYKVYLGGTVSPGAGRGAQIVEPYDTQIFEEIVAITSAASVPRCPDGWTLIGQEQVNTYVERVLQLLPEGPRDLRIVLTSLHGVGGQTALTVLHEAGFRDVVVVDEQHDPDPDFPTVAFPNPEEPGVLNLALSKARDVGADLVLANDPDADRVAVAVPDNDVDGGWRQLTGDEVGSLLGLIVAREHAKTGRSTTFEGVPAPVLANSVVSSRLLSHIAHSHGLEHEYTLTGFKWITRAPHLIYGYEEALGYCVDPTHVRDKDGISAGAKLAVFAAQLKAEGRSLLDELNGLAEQFGLYATAPWTIRVDDLGQIARGMSNLREHSPTELADSRVMSAVDLAHGYYDLPPTDGLLYVTERNDRIVVRPSGTEPKLKCYLEVIEPVGSDGVSGARHRAAGRLERLQHDLNTALGLN